MMQARDFIAALARATKSHWWRMCMGTRICQKLNSSIKAVKNKKIAAV
jgi:hypothetical protein